jgi:hypothetical protein
MNLILHTAKKLRTGNFKTVLGFSFLVLFLLGHHSKIIAQVKKPDQTQLSDSKIINCIYENGFFIFNEQRIDLQDAKKDYYEIKSAELLKKNGIKAISIQGRGHDAPFDDKNKKFLDIEENNTIAIYTNTGINSTVLRSKARAENYFKYKITSKTSDPELKTYKKELKDKHNINFDYNNITRNSEGRITGLKLSFEDKNNETQGQIFKQGTQAIEPLNFLRTRGKIRFETMNNLVLHKVQKGGADFQENPPTARDTISQNKKGLLSSSNENKTYNTSFSYSLLLRKTSTEEDLQNCKKFFEKKNVRFSYTGVKRNVDGDIIKINLSLAKGKNSQSNSAIENNLGIPDIKIGVRNDNSLFIESQ